MAELRNQLDELSKGIVAEKEKALAKEQVPTEVINAKLDAEMKEFVDKVQEEIKANPMYATSAGQGAELIPDSVTMNDVINVTRNKETFIQGMTGFHGNTLQENVKIPIIGDIGYAKGGTEWQSGNFFESDVDSAMPTGDITIPQKMLKKEIGISSWLKLYSVTDIVAKLREQLPAAFVYSVADALLNGDSTATSTGNINSDDQAPATTFSATGGLKDRRVLIDDGLRKQPLNGSANVDTLNIGTIDMTDIFKLFAMHRGDTTPDKMLMIMDKFTYYTLMAIDDFKDISKNGKNSTITKAAITNIGGTDVFVTDNMRRTEADGKLSGATPANNTKGQIILANRNVMQYGYGQQLQTQIYSDIEKGVLVKGVLWYGQASINKKAGETDPMVVAGINITVS